MNSRRDRASRPWLLYALGVVAIVIAALAVSEIGPPTSSARTSKEVVAAAQGVVQSTVTGSGNIAAGTDLTVNFNTSGTLQDVYVTVGQHVNSGQLLADLDPTSADLQLSQAQSQLTAAEDQLTCLQDQTTANCGSSGSGGGSGSSGSASTGSGTASDTSLTSSASDVEFASFKPGAGEGKKPTSGTGETETSTKGGTKITKKTPSVTVTVIVPSTKSPSSSGGSAGKTSSTATTTTTSTPSPSSLASAQASVYSAQAAVHTAEIAVNNTKLYAPTSGTIASLSSLTPGDSVSAGSSGGSSSSSSSSTSSGASSTGGETAGSLGGSSSSSSSSSGFAEIVNTSSLTMTVDFSESDISSVHVGQSATVTLDALAGVELAAHVSSISLVGSTSSSVVSYDATLTLDQNDNRVKPGMSASASVITGQASGVTVPNAAVTGTGSLGTVTLDKNGKDVTQQVVVGLRGDSRTQIISGVSAGDQLVITIALPSLSSTSTSGSSGSGTLGGGGLGGAGGFGGAGGLGGGGGAFFRRAAGGG
jgi:multidrug efflux pump subunit AcrA (membrane-fusion protein)